jgi:hypothetical protein
LLPTIRRFEIATVFIATVFIATVFIETVFIETKKPVFESDGLACLIFHG